MYIIVYSYTWLPGTFSPPPWISDPDMHHDTCVRHVPWCMPESLTSGLLWSQWGGKRFRHSRRMRNPQFYVSCKRLVGGCPANDVLVTARKWAPLFWALSFKVKSYQHLSEYFSQKYLACGSENHKIEQIHNHLLLIVAECGRVDIWNHHFCWTRICGRFYLPILGRKTCFGNSYRGFQKFPHIPSSPLYCVDLLCWCSSSGCPWN